ncbi:MAG: 50S ribosomal protein L34e [Candidatus Aenigmarchaeota archaeon]|nr:50S ribosomal protein L34e [Candidatus Aenigmarchaeota archaeon]
MRLSKSLKKYKIKTPGGKNVTHFKKKRSSYDVCKNCGTKLNRPKLSVKKLKRLPKTKKRPQRPFPELCSKCMREYFKEKVR